MRKSLLLSGLLIFILIASISFIVLPANKTSAATLQVFCIGDSITYGIGSSSGGPATGYPATLQKLLGSGYQVTNYGVSGTTALKVSNYSYWGTSAYTASSAGSPAIVIIMLGSNDSKPGNWNNANYLNDYRALILHYRALSSSPTVYLNYPPPAFLYNYGISNTVIEQQEMPDLRQLAQETGSQLIDTHTALLPYGQDFPDGIHPNDAGAALLAQSVAQGLTGKDLARTFNNRGISNDSNPTMANFDGLGYTYSAQALSAAGLNQGSNFVFNNNNFHWVNSSPGNLDNAVGSGLSVNFTSPPLGPKLAFLGSAVHGPASAPATINYTDGSTQNFTLAFSDWTLNGGTSTPLSGEQIAAKMLYRNGTAGKQTKNIYLFYTDVTLNAGKTVKSLILPVNNSIHIFAVNAGTILSYEAESLTATTNGPANTTSSDPACSGGVCMVFQATAIGNVITYTVQVPAAGIYDLRIGVKKFGNKGIFQFASNGVNHGTPQDLYAAAATFTEVDIGSVTFNTTGTKSFTLTVTGKNAASSGYTLGIDYFKLTN